MKKHFLTGLVILLPIAVTLALLFFIVNFLTNPFVNLLEKYLASQAWFLRHQGLLHFAFQLLLLAFLAGFTLFLGIIARIVAFKSIHSLIDYVLHRIPIIKTIYKAAQQLIQTIFGSGSRSFKQVVMVPFPHANTYSIGLIAGSAPTICSTTFNQNFLTVFVPTTPNPTSGFLMMFREEQVTYLDMKVEDAFKYIISCGVITAETPNLRDELA